MSVHGPSPTSDPDMPTPADLRAAVRRWRRRHRGMATAALVIVTAVWIGVTWVLGDASVEAAASLRSWLTVAASAAALTTVIGLAIGHLGTAQLGWPAHFARLASLAWAVGRRAESRGRPAAAGAVAGVVAGLFLHPAVTIGGAAVLVGMSTTPVGEALAAWSRAGARGRAEASGGPEPMSTAGRRLLALSAGLSAALVAVVRWAALDPACDLGYILGGACGLPPLGVAVVAVASGLATVPIFVTLGALVSYVLDDEPLAPRLPTPRPEPRDHAASETPKTPPPGPLFGGVDDEPEEPETPSSVEVEPQDVAPRDDVPTAEPLTEDDPTLEVELVELAAKATLFEETQEDTVPADDGSERAAPAASEPTLARLVATELEALSPEGRSTLATLVRSVDPRDEVDGDLGERLAELPPGALSDALGRIRTSLPTLEVLRAQYGRAPSPARSAIERTSVAGLRAAGIPQDDASVLADGLLNLGREDWQVLRDTLDRLDDHLDERGV